MENIDLKTISRIADQDSGFEKELTLFMYDEDHYSLTRTSGLEPAFILLQNCKWILKEYYPIYISSEESKTLENRSLSFSTLVDLIISKLTHAKSLIFELRDLPENQNYEGYERFKENVVKYEYQLSNIILLIEKSELPKNRINKLKQASIIEEEKEARNNNEGCYIATMIYEDYDHPKVQILRKFRDERLATSKSGRRFIEFYYKHSPNWVEIMKNQKKSNTVIRLALEILIKLVK